MKKFEDIWTVIARRRFNADVAISLIKERMNKESLFARTTCLMRLPRLRLAMTISALALALCLGIISKARAETWNCGPRNSKGEYSNSVTCTYDENTKTLTIAGEGEMGGYGNTKNDTSTAPWYGKDIKYAVIEKGVTSIGARTFKSQSNLESISGLENITSIGQAAFAKTSKLKSLDMPNVTNIDASVFLAMPEMSYVGLPETATIHSYRNNVLNQLGCITKDGYKTCGTCNEYIKSGTGCVSECGSGYYTDFEAKRCIKGCVNGQVEYKGECLDEYPFAKKHWTPAEANEWLNEDDNTITLTFKMQ